MHLFIIHQDHVLEAQTAPSSTHTAGGLILMDALDPSGHGLVERPWLAFAGLVVGAGSCESEPLTKFGGRHIFTRREQGGLDLVHDFTSGNGFPCTSQAIL